jgi:murein DD-endopeptidase MepM/ murein hydrolase activator NlpD
MLTALVTFLATLFGIWWPTNEDRKEAADEAAALDQQVQDLTVELDAQQQVNADLENEVGTQARTITSLQEQLDQRSSSPDDDEGPSTPGGGPTEVYRETGAEPLRFNEGYGVDLDTLDEDWGVGQIFGTLDLYLDSSSEGLRLGTPPGVVAIMDGEASYEDCRRTTDLQDRLSTGETVPGTQFCLKTNGDRWAFVTILEVERAEEAIAVDVVVWAPQE